MRRYEVLVRSRFEAAHHLTSYRGGPEPVHGHSFLVEARIGADQLGPDGFAIDFVEAQERLDALAGRFRHADINRVSPFDQRSPTAEHLAEWFFVEIASWLDGLQRAPGTPNARLTSVTVWEGPDCAATFSAEPPG
jgi:6-pyruvoyltetrahydropterin/6-carboxytetrahydropterin synthase